MEDKNITRRALLCVSAAGAGTVALGGAWGLIDRAHADDAAATTTTSATGGPAEQYGFLVAITRCSGCGRCVEACRRGNSLSDSTEDRRRVESYTRTRGRAFFASTSCMHCAEPSCMAVCPAGAIWKDEKGLVRVDQQRCMGCKYCYQACPYGVPTYNEVAMDKCDGCRSAGLGDDEAPYCVQACKFGALEFGPISQLKETVGKAAVPIAEANNPSCLVLAPEKGES